MWPVIAALLLMAPQERFFDLPDDVRSRYRAEVERLRTLRHLPRERYDDILDVLSGGYLGPAAGGQLIRDLTQLFYDLDRGHAWISSLAFDLELDAFAPIRAGALPATIEVCQATLHDGATIIGPGGPLWRRFPGVDRESLGEQHYLDPNLGVPSAGDLWISSDQATAFERVRVPLPKAFLINAYEESLDEDGRLRIDGHWFRPGRGVEHEEIALAVEEVTDGATRFANRDLGVVMHRPTLHYPSLAATVDLGRAKPPVRPRPSPAVTQLSRVVERLLERAPDDHVWPRPFNPESARAARVLLRDDLIDHDPAESLRRLRLALTYGDDLPGFALLHPRRMLELERRVIAFLNERPAGEIPPDFDYDAVAAAVRHAPHLDVDLPADHLGGRARLRLPPDYSPWRKWPLLLAYHGQGGAPSHELNAWSDVCDERGVILVCPPHGSTSGAARTREADDAMLDVIRRARLRLNVDPDRVYATGLSMGGATTWHLARQHPGIFAGIAPEIRGPTRWNDRFPLLANVTGIPVFQLETEFDGLNTGNARDAIDRLRRLGGTVEYREPRLLGHTRLHWLYGTVLDWLLTHRRDPRPTRVEHQALHQHRARHAWLRIVRPSRAHAWTLEDGTYVLADLTGVEAAYVRGHIRLRRTDGTPREVELFHDPTFMADTVEIRAGGKTTRWTPRRSIDAMLEQVRVSGDRARLYPDSIRVEMR